MSDDHRALIQRFWTTLYERDFDGVGAFFAPDGEYTDVMSGRRDDRPHYQALLAEVRRLRAERRPVVVVVAALDRFGRKLLERVRCREELKALSRGNPPSPKRFSESARDLRRESWK